MAAAAIAVWLSVTVLGQTVSESAAGLDNCVTNLTRRELVGPVSEILELDRSFVEKALVEKELKVSELVFIKAIAAKTAQPPEKILLNQTNRDWLASVKKAGVDEKAIVEQLDNTYADLALKAMSLPHKRKHHPSSK
jgi:hypothetical protein